MASPLFFERLRHDCSLELFLKGHLLQTAVFFFQLFHARHHGYINTTVLGHAICKRSSADTLVAANIGNAEASFNPFDRIHYLDVTEF